MYVVLENINLQHFVKIGSLIKTFNMSKDIGSILHINSVVLLYDNNNVIVGDPYVKGVNVSLKVLKVEKGKKIKVIKFKRRKNYIRHIGFRSMHTILEVLNIEIKR